MMGRRGERVGGICTYILLHIYIHKYLHTNYTYTYISMVVVVVVVGYYVCMYLTPLATMVNHDPIAPAALRASDLPEQDDPSAHHCLEFNQSSESRALRPSTVSFLTTVVL
jgi:hypothetical protein